MAISTVTKKRGRKLNCNLEEVNLRPGGKGGRVMDDNWRAVHDKCTWNFGVEASSSEEEEEEEEEDDEEEEEEITGDKKNCVSDLEGNRLLPIGKIVNAIGNSMCCRKCAVSNHKDMMNNFIAFCSE